MFEEFAMFFPHAARGRIQLEASEAVYRSGSKWSASLIDRNEYSG